MPKSQLKQLKASLHEKGIIGQPQKSKKQKKGRNGADQDERVRRHAALQEVRESFNPFELQAAARPKKFVATTARNMKGGMDKGQLARPGVTRSLGEESRRRTLLLEMRRRNKVGGILDRRIGENDPKMAPEERALQRFAREKQRKKTNSLFNLEGESEDEEAQLTHLGQTLSFDRAATTRDDFDEADTPPSADEEASPGRDGPLQKRRRSSIEENAENQDSEDDLPERKKTKSEVMKEVISKSKLYKYERQQAKEDDETLREELDKGLPDILAALKGGKMGAQQPGSLGSLGDNTFAMNPDRAAFLNGSVQKSKAEKEYDERVREMVFDKRSKPTGRTKTEDEKIEEEVRRLQELENQRLRRMRGEEDGEDDSRNEERSPNAVDLDGDAEGTKDDAAEFGFANAARSTNLDVEAEDEFVIDDDLVGSVSDASDIESALADAATDEEVNGVNEEDEFLDGLLSRDERGRPEFARPMEPTVSGPHNGLAFTYPCPQSHQEFLDILRDVSLSETPTVVQRIRALYHPQLKAENKEKLARFCAVLVDHLSYLAVVPGSLPVAESLIRHLQSLSRTFPDTIATAFRSHLAKMHRRDNLSAGDLIVLTAIGSIYPTSDHFHQVVTPAITIMAMWLEMSSPQSQRKLTTGAYLVALCLKYQRLSRRYIPEVVKFTLTALRSKASPENALPHIRNLEMMLELWKDQSAFIEIFAPETLRVLSELKQTKILQKLQILLDQARLSRRPLELHHHRPLPIKSSVPKFEESFNPDKHYDPDRERSEASKLRAEYKRKKKGAVRELRKDASFIARERLREKKEADRAYESKYKRLVAEIQGEEGKEKNAYERIKKARKAKR